jgi:hypothetical protein
MQDFGNRFSGLGNELGVYALFVQERLSAPQRLEQTLGFSSRLHDAQQRDLRLTTSRDQCAQPQRLVGLFGAVTANQYPHFSVPEDSQLI